ncbi:MAG: preprotein translocase subunit SecA [Bacteroidota bacterium]
MLGFLKNILPSKKDKDIRDLKPLVEEINEVYSTLSGLTDDELRGKTNDFKAQIQEYTQEISTRIQELEKEAKETLDIDAKEGIYQELDQLKEDLSEQLEEVLMEILPEAFAVVKETARRFSETGYLQVQANEYDRDLAETREHIEIKGDTAIWKNKWLAADSEVLWNMVHYDVQLMGGVVLHTGKIAEMATGEGKTLVATLPVYLNALTGKGVHVITVNNYLAKRDSQWNAPLFQFHGLTVDCIDLHQPNSDERRKAYLADITYGTNNEFGFDYLRDNMTTHPEFLVQRAHHYTIIDEIDSVLIDEARTPLIISGPVPQGDKHEYAALKPRIERLVKRQRQLVTKYITEAKSKIAAGNNDEGGLALFRAYKGLPKNNALIRFLSESGTKVIMNKTEGFYMQDNSKNMHVATDPLFFTIDEKNRQVELTDQGRELIAEAGEDPDLFVLPDVAQRFNEIEKNVSLNEEDKLKAKDALASEFAEKSERLHAINQLLKAYCLFEKDVDYIVQDGKVNIVDEQTGRVLPGRRYSDGLHQAIESKENVKVEAATQTFATVTLQNYFRMYHKLAGMTGTAETEEAEFFEIYKLDVVVVPTNRPILRDDRDDQVYKTKKEKYNAIIEEIERLRQDGQPVLVGTTSVEVSELVSRMLKIRKVPHNVLNAKQHQREAEIVTEAGKGGAVTIATNMAGRGTDIKLGEGVKSAGGLAVIGTERHESRRIDRQLRGRSGRQGDPGMSQFYVSLEDDLMRLFNSERIAKVMDRMGMQEGEVIQHSLISKSISNAQKKVEENNFAMRKRLLEYDDVMNSQREVIYQRRRNALYGDRIKIDLENMLYDMSEAIVDRYYNIPDADSLRMEAIRILSVDPAITEEDLNDLSAEEVIQKVFGEARAFYQRKTTQLADTLAKGIEKIKRENPQTERILIPFSDGSKRLQIIVPVADALETKGQSIIDELEKVCTLAVIDEKWKNHLREMDELKQSVQNAVFEQKDPLLVYKFEAFELFQQGLNDINQQVLSLLFKSDLHVERTGKESTGNKRDDFSKLNAKHSSAAESQRKQQMNAEKALMRNTSGDQPQRRMTRNERRAQERAKGKKRFPKSR